MHTTPDKLVPTSLKLPPELKAQIDTYARAAGLSAHAFMVKTLADATQRQQQRQQFDQDTAAAWSEAEATGLGYPLEAVRSYFEAKAAWRQGKGPAPAPLVPSPEV